MRILFATDSHFRATNPPAWKINYLERLRKLFDALYLLIEKINPEMLIFGGDVFDSPTVVSGEVLNTAIRSFSVDLGRNFWNIIPGQHDGSLRQDSSHCILSALNDSVCHTTIYWEPKKIVCSTSDLTIGFIPHGKVLGEKTDIVVCHEDLWDSKIHGYIPKILLLGHLHIPQKPCKLALGTIVAQPGSMGRMTRAEALLPVYVAVLDTSRGFDDPACLRYYKLADGLASQDLLSSKETFIAEQNIVARREALTMLENLSQVKSGDAQQILSDLIFELNLTDNFLSKDEAAKKLARDILEKYMREPG